MLLDRKRVKFWQKWIFLFMAILMASFLIFGYSGVLQSCSNRVGLSQANPYEQQIKELTAKVRANPNDGQAIFSLAEAYQAHASTQTTGSSAQSGDYANAIGYYERFLKLKKAQQGATPRASQIQALEALGQLYVAIGDWSKVVNVYERLTTIEPKKADYFYSLGVAAQQAGDTQQALLAFTRYLQLAPNSAEAATIRQWMKQQAQSASPGPSTSPTTSPTASPTP